MILNFDKIASDIGHKKFYPVYILTGEEAYYIDAVSHLIENNVLAEHEKIFNQTIVYGKDINPAYIKEACLRFPMMAEYNVLIVREAQDCKKLMDEMLPYFERPNKSTILVLCIKYQKLDKRTKVYKSIEKNPDCCVLEASKIKENLLVEWIENYLKNNNFQITRRASILLADYLGNNLSTLSNELEKLILIKKDVRQIDLQDIETHIGISKEYNVYELQKALATKNIQKVTRIYNYLKNNSKAAAMNLITGTLFSYFFKAFVFENPKKNVNTLHSEMGMEYWQVNELQPAIQNYHGKIDKVLEIIREYELKSKGINSREIPDSELLKEMIFKILAV
ncbi:MAG TPA: DNA polymerase III subunit delta [Bacteroidia bacterium]|nr:DNA polymerase III subunit delta [Bacteroidia bacterium]HRS60023.1 DNA polymerase III subunit delta [Bacteroidia bacterium]HRU68938.1 DNA polymerase III subunit delta [Bacteroidia bacterium]